MIPAVTNSGAVTVLERYGDGLFVAATWGDNATTRRYSRLLPKQILRAIVDEATQAIAVLKAEPPATYLEATRAAQILIGSYPNVKPHDPEIYLKGLSSVFHEYSATTAMRAVDMLTRTNKYLPARSEVLEACRACVEKPGAKHWAALYLAERQLAEHAERERDAQIESQTPEQRARIAEQIKRACGVVEEEAEPVDA
jgi:hypothetical protein